MNVRFSEATVALRRHNRAVTNDSLQPIQCPAALQPATRERVPKLVNMEPLDACPPPNLLGDPLAILQGNQPADTVAKLGH